MKPRDAIDQIDQPTFEDELRATANWLKQHSTNPVAGIPTYSVMIPPEFALRISGWLTSYADTMENGV